MSPNAVEDVSCRHDRPQLLARINRIGWRIHMLLEGIDPQVDRPRYGWRDRLPREPVVLDLEMYFPIPVTNGVEFMFAIIKELVARTPRSGRLGMEADCSRRDVHGTLSACLMTFP